MSPGAPLQQPRPPRSRAAGHILMLSGGTVLGQIATMAVIPLVTRLYTPADMGLYAAFVALAGIFSTTIALHYELAIPLPRTLRAADRVLVVALAATLLCAVLIGIAAWLCAGLIQRHIIGRIGGLDVRTVLWLLPLALILQGIANTLTMRAVRTASFARTAAARGAQGIVQSLLQVAAGWMESGVMGLLAGQVAGQVAAIVPFVSGARTAERRRGDFGAARLWAVARRYWRFPLIATWSSLINALTANLPVILLASSFDAAIAGKFALSFRVLQLPLRLLGQAVSQVFFSGAVVAARSEGALSATTERSFRFMFRFAFPCFAVLACVGPRVFGYAFGSVWYDAGVYTQLLAPWLFFGFLATVLAVLVSVLNLQAAEFGFQIALLVATLAAVAAGAAAHSAQLAVGVLGNLAGALLLIKLLWLLRRAGVALAPLGRFCAREMLRSAPLIVALLVLAEATRSDRLVSVAAAVALVALEMLSYFRRERPSDSAAHALGSAGCAP